MDLQQRGISIDKVNELYIKQINYQNQLKLYLIKLMISKKNYWVDHLI